MSIYDMLAQGKKPLESAPSDQGAGESEESPVPPEVLERRMLILSLQDYFDRYRESVPESRLGKSDLGPKIAKKESEFSKDERTKIIELLTDAESLTTTMTDSDYNYYVILRNTFGLPSLPMRVPTPPRPAAAKAGEATVEELIASAEAGDQSSAPLLGSIDQEVLQGADEVFRDRISEYDLLKGDFLHTVEKVQEKDPTLVKIFKAEQDSLEDAVIRSLPFPDEEESPDLQEAIDAYTLFLRDPIRYFTEITPQTTAGRINKDDIDRLVSVLRRIKDVEPSSQPPQAPEASHEGREEALLGKTLVNWFTGEEYVVEELEPRLSNRGGFKARLRLQTEDREVASGPGWYEDVDVLLGEIDKEKGGMWYTKEQFRERAERKIKAIEAGLRSLNKERNNLISFFSSLRDWDDRYHKLTSEIKKKALDALKDISRRMEDDEETIKNLQDYQNAIATKSSIDLKEEIFDAHKHTIEKVKEEKEDIRGEYQRARQFFKHIGFVQTFESALDSKEIKDELASLQKSSYSFKGDKGIEDYRVVGLSKYKGSYLLVLEDVSDGNRKLIPLDHFKRSLLDPKSPWSKKIAEQRRIPVRQEGLPQQSIFDKALELDRDFVESALAQVPEADKGSFKKDPVSYILNWIQNLEEQIKKADTPRRQQQLKEARKAVAFFAEAQAHKSERRLKPSDFRRPLATKNTGVATPHRDLYPVKDPGSWIGERRYDTNPDELDYIATSWNPGEGVPHLDDRPADPHREQSRRGSRSLEGKNLDRAIHAYNIVMDPRWDDIWKELVQEGVRPLESLENLEKLERYAKRRFEDRWPEEFKIYEEIRSIREKMSDIRDYVADSDVSAVRRMHDRLRELNERIEELMNKKADIMEQREEHRKPL